jgi:hypothetical protein
MTSHRVRKWDIIAWEGFISYISTRIRNVFAHEQLVDLQNGLLIARLRIQLHASQIQLLVIFTLSLSIQCLNPSVLSSSVETVNEGHMFYQNWCNKFDPNI